MEPVTKTSAPTAVIAQLRDAIRRGEYKPGDKLPSETQLSELLHIGRGSIREALKRMETMGIVEIRHGKGAYVLHSTDFPSLFGRLAEMIVVERPQLIELMQARKAIEAETAALATREMRDADIVKLRGILEAMQRTIEQPEEFIRHDLAYHLLIAKGSGNSILNKFLNIVRTLFMKEQKAVVSLPGAAARAFKYHSRLVDAIESRKPALARRIMVEHLSDIEAAIEQFTA